MFKIAFLIFITVFANAQSKLVKEMLESANELYYEENDIKSSIPLYKLAAKNGSIEAKAQLLKMYYYGIGVPKERQKAQEIYKEGVINKIVELAQNDNAFAQYLYGYFLSHGTFMEEDENEAIKWYKKAIRRGNITAINNLGAIYKDKGDCKKALFLYKKARDKGEQTAIYNMGVLYENGNCVDKDIKKAIAYFRQVHNNPNATKRLKKLENQLSSQDKEPNRYKTKNKTQILKRKILNAKLYKNNCSMPNVPEIDASKRELNNFVRERERFYNCQNRILEKNQKILIKLIKETGGRVVKENGGYRYHYSKVYQYEFGKLFKRMRKIVLSMDDDNKILSKYLKRREEKVKDANRWNRLNQMFQEGLNNRPHYGI